ncbi:unnamed protein product [Penicillium roqueforti FM164]|uniref:Genomic scaffold, ProqFM164S01 n=1 Tax=Penicillium roqueforti (strain FM164) TaxID=1365484 RepID=W6QB57_PENRF|nr:unnamed protein product [Penicillium roqueforti FM164]
MRAWSSRAKAPISLASMPSRKDVRVSWREEVDLAELAVASTKSITVGSDAPVRRKRFSDTKSLLSMGGAS